MWRPPLKPPLDIQWASGPQLAAFRRRQQLYQWSGLAFCLRHDRWNQDVLAHELMMFKELVLELRQVPPLGLTLDLFALFRQGEQFAPRRLDEEDHSFERLLLRIQNDLLYRLVRFPMFRQLRRLLLRLSPKAPEPKPGGLVAPLSLQDRALVYLVGQLLEPIRDTLVEGYRPSLLPTFSSEKDAPDWWLHAHGALDEFEESIGRKGWCAEQIQHILDQLLRLNNKDWLQTSWLPILTHFELLHNKLERLRWQQMAWSFEQIPPPDDMRLLFQLRDAGYHDLLLPSRSIVPEGGIQGLCRRGELSSMVPSELLYWEEHPKQSVDIFALRVVERELLYYEREQNITYTWQRRLQILLDLDPGEIRFKGQEVPVSGMSLLFGFLSRLTVDLRHVCPEEVLRIEYILSPARDWEEECSTYQIFLNSTAEVGGSTHMELVQDLGKYAETQPQQSGDFRLLITTPSRLQALRKASQRVPHQISICVIPSTRSLPLIGLEDIFQKQENSASPLFVNVPDALSSLQPKHDAQSTQSELTEVPYEGERWNALPHRGDGPDLILSLQDCKEHLEGFVRMRDLVLQSILRAPPDVEGNVSLLKEEL